MLLHPKNDAQRYSSLIYTPNSTSIIIEGFFDDPSHSFGYPKAIIRTRRTSLPSSYIELFASSHALLYNVMDENLEEKCSLKNFESATVATMASSSNESNFEDMDKKVLLAKQQLLLPPVNKKSSKKINEEAEEQENEENIETTEIGSIYAMGLNENFSLGIIQNSVSLQEKKFSKLCSSASIVAGGADFHIVLSADRTKLYGIGSNVCSSCCLKTVVIFFCYFFIKTLKYSVALSALCFRTSSSQVFYSSVASRLEFEN